MNSQGTSANWPGTFKFHLAKKELNHGSDDGEMKKSEEICQIMA